jgi:Ca-activated chloride channel family protein
MRHPFSIRPLWILFVLAFQTGLPRIVAAQGILFPRHDVRIQPFYVKNLRVRANITDGIAETSVEQTFVNDSFVEQEGTYLYPLPEGAMPTSFSMTVGDRTLEPTILRREEARSIYESIVRRRRDPALLEYVGRNLVQISVFPIPAHGERVIRMRYTEVLKAENGLHRYAFPLSTSRFGARPVGVASLTITLHTSTPIKNIYSPTHDLLIRRTDDRIAMAGWEGANEVSDRDLSLYYSLSGDDVGLSLLTYRTGERDGYFALLAAPRVVVPRERILPKQVVFVLDRTGSMAGKKIEQARKSLLYCLNSLHAQDRFDLITFNESPDILLRHLEPATEANLDRARRFVDNIEAAGGTNIDEALRAALDLLRDEEGTQKMVVFLTDGLPTVGETDINTILSHVRHNLSPNAASALRSRMAACARSGARPRIFCFGLGYDVNVPFLDRLGVLGRGDSDYVKPEEDVEAHVSSFFAKVASPILSDVHLAFDGVDVYDVFPKELPDLCRGSQLVITGRFRGSGKGTIRLVGLANGAAESFKIGADFDAADGADSFLPRLWAQRKIGYLIDQVRLSNNSDINKEVIDEIVRLSREYGIITEYTSFLVDDREQQQLGLQGGIGGIGGGTGVIRQEVDRRARQFGISGEGVTDQSNRAKDYKASDQFYSRYQSANGSVAAPTAAPAGPGGYPGMSGSRAARGNFGGALGKADRSNGSPEADRITVQAVGGRTFYLQANKIWQDQTYISGKQTLVKIQAFSDAHFALIKAVPSLALYSSVGDELIIRVGHNAIQIGKEGKEKLTAAEIKQLTQ